MGHKIIWSPEAVADLTEIRAYIARDSDAYAAAMIERILLATDRLSDFPRLGRRFPEVDEEALRQVVVDRYRVIYRVREYSVDIAAVVHGSRELSDLIANRGL